MVVNPDMMVCWTLPAGCWVAPADCRDRLFSAGPRHTPACARPGVLQGREAVACVMYTLDGVSMYARTYRYEDAYDQHLYPHATEAG
jgi:hypothetical protein